MQVTKKIGSRLINKITYDGNAFNVNSTSFDGNAFNVNRTLHKIAGRRSRKSSMYSPL